jgi:hypothetical protein
MGLESIRLRWNNAPGKFNLKIDPCHLDDVALFDASPSPFVQRQALWLESQDWLGWVFVWPSQ